MKNLLFTSIFILLTFSQIYSQSVGFWPDNSGTPTSSKTNTFNALGIGTITPNGWQEIKYCPPLNIGQNGLVVTKFECNNTGMLPNFNLPDMVGNLTVSEGQSSSQTPFVFTISHNTTTGIPLLGSLNPLIWARTETPGTNFAPAIPGGVNSFETKFIVMPDGSTGINIPNPRAALDVRGANGTNRPAAIIGSRAMGTNTTNPATGITSYNTQHVEFIPILGNNGFNKISKSGDQGMFFTDGKGPAGVNLRSAFIIAPWSTNTSQDGIRIESDGNVGIGTNNTFGFKLAVNGTIVCREEFKVTNIGVNWPDYIFDTFNSNDSIIFEYSTLYMKNFIKKNGHLPYIPSKKKIENDGFNMVEGYSNLLKQVEVLSLQIIELNKQLELLKKKNDN